MSAESATPAWAEPLLEAYRRGRSLALLFDYDGTLAPIAPHPSLARLPGANRERLARLAALPDVAVGVVSGRALAEVRQFVGLPGLYYAGSGGIEIDLRGRRLCDPGAGGARPFVEAAAAELAPLVGRFPGAWVEHKPAALAVHYRRLTPASAARFRAEAEAVLARHPGVRHREVSISLEVTPVGGWDKGTAVEAIVGAADPGAVPLFAGDAANDSEAMAVADLAGGVTVGVGPDAPAAAAHRVATPEELAAGLEWLADALPKARGLAPPERPAPPADRPAPPDPEGTGATAGPAGGPGVLVVDADPGVRASFAAAFARLGWRVWAAADPAEALGTLHEQADSIRAAVIDLQYPGFQGLWALNEVGRQAPEVVRAGSSGDVAPYAAAAFRRLSRTPLFAKPFDFPVVAAALRRLIEPTGGGDRPSLAEASP